MRHLRMTLGLAVTACAFAVAGTPAMAAQFVSSGGETHGKGVGPQKFELGPFKITCKAAPASSGPTTPMESKTFFTRVHFKMCTTRAKVGENPITLKTKFMTPFDIEYHANGFVEVGSESELEEEQVTLKGGSIEMKVSAIKCIIVIPEQTLPKKAEKTPEEEFFQAKFVNIATTMGNHKMEIKNKFTKIHFEFSEGQCENFKKTEEELKSGKAFGAFMEKINMGNIEWQP